MTLHKYLYANANPVKYKDPSGNMGSLQECNLVSAISAELYKNQNVVMGMAVLNGIGKSVMTGLCGGDAGDMTAAFLEGVIEGAAMGMLFCAVAAVLATSMLTVMMAHTAASSVVSIVLAIYSVSEGDYLNALVYGAVAVAGIIGVCRWYKVTYQIDYVGEKGIARFAGGSGNRTINGFNTTVNAGKQGKHLVGNNNYIEGRSIFNGTVDDAQRLVDNFAGKGEWIGTNKERVNFGKVIGQYVNPETNGAVETTIGIIHYSKTGTHIVPAQPIQ